MNKKALWLRLKHYTFHHVVTPQLSDRILQLFGGTDASLHAFASKIAKKHEWKKRFTLQAMEEYKKFLFLGVTADFQVTPSTVIDVIWHEHILFSKAYREFCDDVLQQPFDHYPELIPIVDETGRFSAQYADTLSLYATEFGLPAPEAFWGKAKFDEEQKDGVQYKSRKKEAYQDSIYAGDAPLVSSFDTHETQSSAYPEFSGFGEGGAGFDGGGNSDSWGDGDSSDGGGDSGGCSSGCGGCGGGD